MSTEPPTTVPPTDPTEALAEIPQPDVPSAPGPQTFKCEKCGATFEDEGSAAAHIQTCSGLESSLPENDNQEE